MKITANSARRYSPLEHILFDGALAVGYRSAAEDFVIFARTKELGSTLNGTYNIRILLSPEEIHEIRDAELCSLREQLARLEKELHSLKDKD
jgi:hypothetical protein